MELRHTDTCTPTPRFRTQFRQASIGTAAGPAVPPSPSNPGGTTPSLCRCLVPSGAICCNFRLFLWVYSPIQTRKHRGRAVPRWGWAEGSGVLCCSSDASIRWVALIAGQCHHWGEKWGETKTDLSNSGDDSWSNKTTAVFPRKSSNIYFIWGAEKLTAEVRRHSGGEVSRKICRVCKAVLSESSTVPLHFLTEKRFQQHMKEKCLCKLGPIYFPFRTMGGRQILIHRWQGQLTRSGSCYRGPLVVHMPKKPRRYF